MDLFLIFFIILIIFIIFIFIFRYSIFGIDSNLSPSEYSDLGYGYYSSASKTSCLNQSGFCSEPGIVSEISLCIPNSSTKKGCINSSGFQTFNSKISQQDCSTSCRYSIWNQPIISQCLLPSPIDDVCITDSQKGFITLEKTCIQNDAYGMNTCTYDINLNSEIFPGCVLSNNGYTVECSVGSVYKEIKECNSPINPSTNLPYDICGSLEVDTSLYENYPPNCYYTSEDFYIPNHSCIPLLNNIGYRKFSMKCNKKFCSNNISCIDDSTVSGKKTILNHLKNNLPFHICGSPPFCGKPCTLL